jgi:hypothetical protein
MMNGHIFLCVNAANQGTVGGSTLLAFQTMQEADRYIRDWLEKSCGLECYRGAEEEAILRAENQGELPEFAFSCPKLENPSDLELYNGFYYYGSGGSFHLFVMAIYDEPSAVQFRKEITKEYELDKTFSEKADEMQNMLDVLVNSFRETLDYTTALHQVDTLLKNEGLSLF